MDKEDWLKKLSDDFFNTSDPLNFFDSFPNLGRMRWGNF